VEPNHLPSGTKTLKLEVVIKISVVVCHSVWCCIFYVCCSPVDAGEGVESPQSWSKSVATERSVGVYTD